MIREADPELRPPPRPCRLPRLGCALGALGERLLAGGPRLEPDGRQLHAGEALVPVLPRGRARDGPGGRAGAGDGGAGGVAPAQRRRELRRRRRALPRERAAPRRAGGARDRLDLPALVGLRGLGLPRPERRRRRASSGVVLVVAGVVTVVRRPGGEAERGRAGRRLPGPSGHTAGVLLAAATSLFWALNTFAIARGGAGLPVAGVNTFRMGFAVALMPLARLFLRGRGTTLLVPAARDAPLLALLPPRERGRDGPLRRRPDPLAARRGGGPHVPRARPLRSRSPSSSAGSASAGGSSWESSS